MAPKEERDDSLSSRNESVSISDRHDFNQKRQNS
jgi:hypothetical protein